MIASMRLLIGSFVLRVVSGLILDVLVLGHARRPRGLLVVCVGTTGYGRRTCFLRGIAARIGTSARTPRCFRSGAPSLETCPRSQCLPRRVLGLLVLGVEFPLALRWLPVEEAGPVVR